MLKGMNGVKIVKRRQLRILESFKHFDEKREKVQSKG